MTRSLRLSLGAFIALCVVGIFAQSQPALARDLHGRFGLGYNSEFANVEGANPVPGVSLKYFFTREFGLEGVAGVSTATPNNSVTALKLLKNIFYETNLNFYFMIGGGLLNVNSGSAGQFITGFGAEFFIPGVESMGLSMETGASLDNVSGSYAFSTLGVSFLNAGMHFYF